MAASHTGKLTGADAVTDAAFAQAGITRVDGLDELIDTAALMARYPNGPIGGPGTAEAPSPGEGVVVYAISGGTGAHMADLCSAAGLHLPELSTELQDQLHEWIPPFLRVSNPVDNGGHPVGDHRGRKILDALVADPDVGVLLCPITGAFPPMSDKLAQDLVDVAETTDKPICVVWGSPVGDEAAYREILLGSSKVAVFRTFSNAVGAIQAWTDWHRAKATYASPFAAPALEPTPAAEAGREVLTTASPGESLSEHDSKALLRAYGIPTTHEVLAATVDEALTAAEQLGWPVVAKASGAALAHKSEVGGVRLGLDDPDAVRAAFEDLIAIPGADGVLIAEQITGGVEVILGVAQDDLFGPVIMAGLGGTLTEVLQDVAFRIPPFSADEAHNMLRSLKGWPILQGVRGQPPADTDALVQTIMAAQAIATDLSHELHELDINPLVIRPHGQGVIALDALAVRRADEEGQP